VFKRYSEESFPAFVKSGSPESRVNALQLRFRMVNFNPALWAFCISAVIRFDIKGEFEETLETL
jgi:hypothetical protein